MATAIAAAAAVLSQRRSSCSAGKHASSSEEEECLLLSLLPDPLLELALSRLPLPSAISASAASRSFRRLLLSSSSSPPFLPSWFFFLGLNHLLPSKSQSFAFDPISFSWFRIPLPSPPPLHNQSSLSSCSPSSSSSSSSFLFALQGPLQNSLSLLSLSPKFTWHTLPSPLSVPRSSPLAVSAFRRFVVVAGGGDPDCDADPRSVEIFDRLLSAWRPADPLPDPLLHAASSSSVVCNGRMYVADCYSGTLAWMDPEEGKWEMAVVERPDAAKWWSLVALDDVGGAGDGRRKERLVAVVLCAGEAAGMKLMEIDEATMQIRGELGRMPPDLLRSLASPGGGGDEEDDDDAMDMEKHVPLRCTGGGSGIIYIYSPSPFADYPLILCKLSPTAPSGGCTWFAPPPLPPPVNRFDHVLCFSAAMPLTAFLSPCPPQRCTEDRF